MIILNKDKRSFTASFLQYLLCKEVIYLFVVFPIGCPENRASVSNVTEGPEGFICKAVIISFFLLFRKPTLFNSYCGSSGGTLTFWLLSTVSRSAVPLPCAIQTPPQARIIGSNAMVSPLAGRIHSIWSSFQL